MLRGGGRVTNAAEEPINIRAVDAHGHEQIHLELKCGHHHSLLGLLPRTLPLELSAIRN